MRGFFQCTLFCVALLVTLVHQTKAQGPDRMPAMPHKQPWSDNGFVGGGGGGGAGRILHAGFLKAAAQHGPHGHPHGPPPPGPPRGGRGGGGGGDSDGGHGGGGGDSDGGHGGGGGDNNGEGDQQQDNIQV